MRIGIDAKWLDRGPISGQVVVEGLLKGLRQVAGTHEIHAFGDAARLAEDHPATIPHECHRGMSNFTANLFRLPRQGARLGLDAMVFQNWVPPRAKLARVAFVTDVSYLDHPEYFSRGERAVLRTGSRFLRHADWVSTISETEHERLKRHALLPAGRSGVVPLGVDRAYLRESSKQAQIEVAHRHGLDGPYVLYVGRINMRKNLVRLIDGFLASHTAQTGVKLALAGREDGASPDLRASLRAAGDRVVLTGFVESSDLPVLYAGSAAVAYVSLDEGFGLPPLEAMASGRPVLASRAGSLVEVTGGHAVLVDPMVTADIAHGIDDVVALSGNTAWLEDARRWAERFTWEKSAARLLDQVERAVDRRHRARVK